MLLPLVILSLALIILRLAAQVFYNLFLHPLRRFPGPLLWRSTRLAYVYHGRGYLHRKIRALHDKYGPVVRIAPDELSFNEPEAWDSIYGLRPAGKGGLPENEKWVIAYAGTKKAPTGMLSAPWDEHAYLRKTLARGFSEKSMKSQEGMIRSHMDNLMTKVRFEGREGKDKVNIRDWISYATFDVIGKASPYWFFSQAAYMMSLVLTGLPSAGDLTFAASFECLNSPDHRIWLPALADEGARRAWFGTLRRMVLPHWLCDYINGSYFSNPNTSGFQSFAYEAVLRRREWTVERPDLLESLIAGEDENRISRITLVKTAGLLLGAGFETTSSLVCATLYLLCRNPSYLAKAAAEVRAKFKTPDDISFSSLEDLPFMQACLDEALRWYPPVASVGARQVMKGGVTIAGEHIPEDMIVSVPHWAASHSHANFREPDEYRPERWLHDPAYQNDKLQVVQPFLVGPRNCIGKNLAVAEMRLMLALFLFHFDIEMPDEYIGWAEKHKFFGLWARGPLEVYLKPRT
ncbi:cytochrome p450 domain-containing protein [Sarocladium implicatum]|nr:cytochrome p450 domain-containing protein [Sarocladium implicatum]